MVPDDTETLVGEIIGSKTLPEAEYKQRLGSMVPGLVASDNARNLDINTRKVKDVKCTNFSVHDVLHQVPKSPTEDIEEEVDTELQQKAAVPPLVDEDTLDGAHQTGEVAEVAVGHTEYEQVMSVSIVQAESGSVNFSYDVNSRRGLQTTGVGDELLIDGHSDGHQHELQVMSEAKCPTEAGFSSFRLVEIILSEVKGSDVHTEGQEENIDKEKMHKLVRQCRSLPTVGIARDITETVTGQDYGHELEKP